MGQIGGSMFIQWCVWGTYGLFSNEIILHQQQYVTISVNSPRIYSLTFLYSSCPSKCEVLPLFHVGFNFLIDNDLEYLFMYLMVVCECSFG